MLDWAPLYLTSEKGDMMADQPADMHSSDEQAQDNIRNTHENVHENAHETEALHEAGASADNAEAASGEKSQEEASELSELDQALLKVAQLQEQLARRNADVYTLQQEYNGYVKRAKADALNQYELGKAKVLESLIGVLDNAYLAREHGDLEGPAGKVLQELESTLSTNFSMERFGAVADAFDPAIHEALMHSTSSDVEFEQVHMLMQPGYRIGDKVLRPARVSVVSPQ